VVIGLALIAMLENMTLPNPMLDLPAQSSTAWTRWLRDQPDGTIVAHVPFPGGATVWDYEIEGWRMLAQTDHRRPIANGFSSYFPEGYVEFQLGMAEQFPEQGLLCQLNKGLRVNTLVVDKQWLAEGDRAAKVASFSEFLSPAYEDQQVKIYLLGMPDEKCVPKR
jgi:hypothetical protein